MVTSYEEISDQSQANTSVSSLNLSQREIKIFLNVKKSAMIDYIKYFLTCTVSLYKTAANSDNTTKGNACFKGQLKNKETKDTSIEKVNAVSNELRQPPRIIGTMQSEIAGQVA